MKGGLDITNLVGNKIYESVREKDMGLDSTVLTMLSEHIRINVEQTNHVGSH